MRSPLCISLVSVMVLLTGLISTAQAAPEPQIISPTWQLEATYTKPKAIALRDAAGDWQWYWCLSYKVVNNTGEDQLFIPEVTIANSNGLILSDGEGVPANVFTTAQGKLDNDLLIRPALMVGRLLQGEDYAKETVVLWPVGETDVDSVYVFIAGLSGETADVMLPGMEEPETVQKTLMLRFELPGTPTTPENQVVVDLGPRWIMR